MLDIGTLMATIGADLSPLKEGLSQAERAMNDSSSKMVSSLDRVSLASKELGKSLISVGKSMTKYVTLPILGAATASFKFYKDFESNMSKVEGLVGVARNQVQAWEQDIIRLVPELGKGPKELADALFFVTSAGMRGAAAMDVLEMSAKASVAGLGEVKVIADLVTSAVNAYGEANLSASQAVDILVGTVREGKAEAPELAGSLGRLLPIASELGVSFDQVGAATAAMTRTGTDAATAATQLRQIMMSLLKPTKQAEDALNRMGTSSEMLRKKMREDGLLAVLMDIRDRTAEFGEEAIASVFGNVRALAGVLDLMGNNLEENKLIFEALTHSAGDLDKALEAAHNTVEYKWNQALVSGQTLMVTFGQSLRSAFLPVLESVISALTALSAKVAGFSDETKRLIGIFAGLAAAIGPALMALGFLMTTVVPGLIKFFGLLRLAVVATQVALGKLAMVVAANPYLAAGMALLFLAHQLAFARKQATELQTVTQEISKRTTALVAEETAEVRKLIDTLKSETVSRKQQAEALERLNAISPQYFSNLQLQGVSAEKASLALRKYVGDLAGQDIMVRRALNTLTDYTKSIREQERALATLKDINTEVFEGFKIGSVTMEQAQSALREYTESTAKQRKEIEQLVSTISDEKTSREEVTSAMARLSELAPALAADLMKERGLVQGLTEAYDAWADAITKKARATAAQEYLIELYEKEFELIEKVRTAQERMESRKSLSVRAPGGEAVERYNTHDVIAFNRANEELERTRNRIAAAVETNIRIQRSLTEATEEEAQQIDRLKDEIDALIFTRNQLMSSGQSREDTQEELQSIDNRIERLEDERKKLEEVIEARKNYYSGTLGREGFSSTITKGIVPRTEEEIEELTTRLRTSTDESEIRNIARQIDEKQRYLQTLTQVTRATDTQSQAIAGLTKEQGAYLKLFKEAESTWDEAMNLRRLALIDEEIKKQEQLIQVLAQIQPMASKGLPEGYSEYQGAKLQPKTFSTDLDILQITQDFQTGIKEIETQAEVFGAAFDAAGAKVHLATRALQAFLAEGLTPADAEVQGMMETLQTFTIDEILIRYSTALDELRAKQELFGQDTDVTSEHIQLVQQTLMSMVAAGIDPANIKFQELIETLRELGIELQNAEGGMSRLGEISDMVANSVASGFMNAAMSGRQSTGQIIKSILAQVTAMLIQQMISTIPPPLNIIAAAGAGALAGTLFNQIPAYASGALAFGPSLGLIGEYPGARTNPEIIAPLDKLQQMLDASIRNSLEVLVQQPKQVQDIVVEAQVNVSPIKVPRIDTPDIQIQAGQVKVPEIRTMNVGATVLEKLAPVEALKWPEINIPDIQIPQTASAMHTASDLSSRMSIAMMDIRLRQEKPIEVRGNLFGNDIYLSNDRTERMRSIID